MSVCVGGAVSVCGWVYRGSEWVGTVSVCVGVYHLLFSSTTSMEACTRYWKWRSVSLAGVTVRK